MITHDLVDAYRLWIFPLLLGRGKRHFGDDALPAGLRLIDTKTSATGVIIATYERAGGIFYGSFALDQPTAAEAERPR